MANNRNNSDMNKLCEIRANTPSVFLNLKHLKPLQAINPSFVTITKLSSSEKWKTFCEGLRWMWKLSEINYCVKSVQIQKKLRIWTFFTQWNTQQDFWKLIIFSITSKHFIIELAQRNSYQFCLVSYSDSGILCLFPLSYNGSN